MLSQKITKDILIMSKLRGDNGTDYYIKDLEKALDLWEKSQDSLINGNKKLGINGNNSKLIQSKYKDIELYFKQISDTSREFLQLAKQGIWYEELIEEQINILERNERIFLKKMDEIVFQYDNEARYTLSVIYRTENILFIMAVLSLIFIAAFIFYPVSQTLKAALWDVVQSNDNTTKLFRTMRGALFIVKHDGEIIIMNSDAEKLIISDKMHKDAFNINEDIKWTSIDIIHMIKKLKEQDRIDDIETEVMDQDGNLIYLIISMVEGTYKGNPVVLLSMHDITSQKKAEETLKRLAVRDKLTGLYNRTFLESIITEEIERSERYEIPMSAYILDLDHFKSINDNYGHPVGDSVLVMTAEILMNNTRISDYAVRIGGEEFVVLMPQTKIEGAYAAAEEVRRVIENSSHPIAGRVTASFGVVERYRGEAYHMLYDRMDSALYEAKESGRNCVIKAVNRVESNDEISMSWKDAWNCGEKKLDEQHKELFRMLSRLVSSFMLPLDKDMAVNRLNTIINKLAEHFLYEESVLENAGYEDYIKHKNIHSQLLEKTKEIRDALEAGTMESSSAFIYLFEDVIVSHLLREDVKFFPILLSDG